MSEASLNEKYPSMRVEKSTEIILHSFISLNHLFYIKLKIIKLLTNYQIISLKNKINDLSSIIYFLNRV